MGNKMLIDAAHPEETRVVVQRGDRVEEFDYESAARKQLRGNIYLAKVTRVESALQAAFVDYGGNRHGFLAFNEIHPDYYQIPVADRRALLEEEARLSRASAQAEDDADNGGSSDFADQALSDDDNDGGAQIIALDAVLPEQVSKDLAEAMALAEEAEDEIPRELIAAKGRRLTERLEALSEAELEADDGGEDDSDAAPAGHHHDGANGNGNGISGSEHVEAVGSGDALEEVPHRAIKRRRRNYKIQEVMKRRQILLVQVVKEERGNKGAALTTYLSLAGRYTVLMPNTASGGGISRKIASPADRKRLRQIAQELDVPEGMGLIIRTAGAARTKAEIKRDFEYLLRLWENVRDLTLESTAPALVYEEGNLIKRSIRDLYNKEIDEVLVAGDTAYREAKEFMRMIMPSHAKNVKPYKEPEPIFIRQNVERQLDAMYSPFVTLRSGGYIVINQTEALVAVDVNSGKSTRQHSIEDTALRTNMEAAEEIARQLRLRDLAGLIVIDFIDMEERRNNRSVERKLKDSLRHDRARIQIGRISAFGLLEMSRQRMRTGVLEGSTSQCPACQGTGIIRSTESVALSVLRSLEDFLRSKKKMDLRAVTSSEVALYILNNKRDYLHDIERRFGVRLGVVTDDRMQGSSFAIEKVEGDDSDQDDNVVVQVDWAFEAPGARKDTPPPPRRADSEDEGRRKTRRKRRRGANGRDEDGERSEGMTEQSSRAEDERDDEREAKERSPRDDSTGEGEDERRVRRARRRGRRGGRRQRARREAAAQEETGAVQGVQSDDQGQIAPADAGAPDHASGPAEKVQHAAAMVHDPARTQAVQQVEEAPQASGSEFGPDSSEAVAEPAKPARAPRRRAAAKPKPETAAVAAPEVEGNDVASAEPSEQQYVSALETAEGEHDESGSRERRRGWWQRR